MLHFFASALISHSCECVPHSFTPALGLRNQTFRDVLSRASRSHLRNPSYPESLAFACTSPHCIPDLCSCIWVRQRLLADLILLHARLPLHEHFSCSDLSLLHKLSVLRNQHVPVSTSSCNHPSSAKFLLRNKSPAAQCSPHQSLINSLNLPAQLV